MRSIREMDRPAMTRDSWLAAVLGVFMVAWAGCGDSSASNPGTGGTGGVGGADGINPLDGSSPSDAGQDAARDLSDATEDTAPGSRDAQEDMGPPCIPKPDGLVAWWRGEGDARDSVGAHHGTGQGQVTFEAGKVGQAFRFDGASYLDIQETPAIDFGAGDFTIVVWVRFATLSDEVTIFQKSIGIYPDDRTYAFEAFPDSYRFVIRQTTGNENDLYAHVSPAVGAFEHVAAVRSGDTLRLYRNGAQIGEQTNGAAIDSGSGGFAHIGSLAAEAPAAWQRYVDGDVDELSLFGRALSAAEIQAIFQADGSGICP